MSHVPDSGGNKWEGIVIRNNQWHNVGGTWTPVTPSKPRRRRMTVEDWSRAIGSFVAGGLVIGITVFMFNLWWDPVYLPAWLLAALWYGLGKFAGIYEEVTRAR